VGNGDKKGTELWRADNPNAPNAHVRPYDEDLRKPRKGEGHTWTLQNLIRRAAGFAIGQDEQLDTAIADWKKGIKCAPYLGQPCVKEEIPNKDDEDAPNSHDVTMFTSKQRRLVWSDEVTTEITAAICVRATFKCRPKRTNTPNKPDRKEPEKEKCGQAERPLYRIWMPPSPSESWWDRRSLSCRLGELRVHRSHRSHTWEAQPDWIHLNPTPSGLTPPHSRETESADTGSENGAHAMRRPNPEYWLRD